MVANAHDSRSVIDWCAYRHWRRLGYCTIYLHIVLNFNVENLTSVVLNPADVVEINT